VAEGRGQLLLRTACVSGADCWSGAVLCFPCPFSFCGCVKQGVSGSCGLPRSNPTAQQQQQRGTDGRRAHSPASRYEGRQSALQKTSTVSAHRHAPARQSPLCLAPAAEAGATASAPVSTELVLKHDANKRRARARQLTSGASDEHIRRFHEALWPRLSLPPSAHCCCLCSLLCSCVWVAATCLCIRAW
jgi:hypothetical protein